MSTPVDQLTFLSQAEFIDNMTTAYGGSLGILPLLLAGDPALGIFDATSTQLTFLQFLLQAIWAAARLSTAVDSDVDSFVADFNLTRLPATFAEGPVTLSAITAPSVAVAIPPGFVIQTLGGAIEYELVADTSQAAWSTSQNAYILPAGQTSITATAQATVAGAQDNVQPGQLSQIQTAIAGIDNVTNGAAITNGLNQETDAALKLRFVLYLESLAEATEAAIVFAATSVQQGLDVLPLENTNVDFEAQAGTNTVVIDNGTGSEPSSLITAVYNAIFVVRAFGIPVNVVGPEVTTVTVALSLILVPDPTEANGVIQANAQTAVVNFINGIKLADNVQTLYLNDIVTAATNSDPNVQAVQLGSVLLNGVAADLSVGVAGLPRTELASVTISIAA